MELPDRNLSVLSKMIYDRISEALSDEKDDHTIASKITVISQLMSLFLFSEIPRKDWERTVDIMSMTIKSTFPMFDVLMKIEDSK